jgi:hypothetical protein
MIPGFASPRRFGYTEAMRNVAILMQTFANRPRPVGDVAR